MLLTACDESGRPENLIVGLWELVSDSTRINGVVTVSYPYQWGVMHETIEYLENNDYSRIIEYEDTTMTYEGEWELDDTELKMHDDDGNTHTFKLYINSRKMTHTSERVIGGETAVVTSRYTNLVD